MLFFRQLLNNIIYSDSQESLLRILEFSCIKTFIIKRNLKALCIYKDTFGDLTVNSPYRVNFRLKISHNTSSLYNVLRFTWQVKPLGLANQWVATVHSSTFSGSKSMCQTTRRIALETPSKLMLFPMQVRDPWPNYIYRYQSRSTIKSMSFGVDALTENKYASCWLSNS